MVRAILEGRKTQTRRIVKPQPETYLGESGMQFEWPGWHGSLSAESFAGRCPYGQSGDVLWVRETWAAHATLNRVKPSELSPNVAIYYRATYHNDSHFTWRPSIFMPRWASRIDLEITGVRVERLQSISEADALAESVDQALLGNVGWLGTDAPKDAGYSYRAMFSKLWDRIYAKRATWESNPWVWVVEFRRVK